MTLVALRTGSAKARKQQADTRRESGLAGRVPANEPAVALIRHRQWGCFRSRSRGERFRPSYRDSDRVTLDAMETRETFTLDRGNEADA